MNRTLRLCLLAIIALYSAAATGQTIYGNEWIDYNKTYYKFKVGKDGIYRIPKSALDAAGVPVAVTGQQFLLFRNVQEVLVYTTTAVSVGYGDYIEFYGTIADGQLDKLLYEKPEWQTTDKISLFTGTACYFLTYDNGSN